MAFRSKIQQGWAFANKMPFARRWARNSGETGGKSGKAAYAALPKKARSGPGKGRGKKR